MTGTIEAAFRDVITQLKRLRRPVVRRLQPGLPKKDINALTAQLPFALARDVVALYRVANGTRVQTQVPLAKIDFFEGYYFLSLEDAVIAHRQQRRVGAWDASWFPVFTNDGGDYYAVCCRKGARPYVIGFIRGEHPPAYVEYTSLRAMLQTIAAAYQHKAFDDLEEYRQLALRLNPGVEYWREEEMPAVEAVREAEAIEKAKVAYALIKKGKVFDGLLMMEEALRVPGLPPWVYVNATYAVQADNNKKPIDTTRTRRIVASSLPHGKKAPDIFLNAAFALAEIEDWQACLDCLSKAKKGGVALRKHLKSKLFSPISGSKRFASLSE